MSGAVTMVGTRQNVRRPSDLMHTQRHGQTLKIRALGGNKEKSLQHHTTDVN